MLPATDPLPGAAHLATGYPAHLRGRLRWARDYVQQQPPAEVQAHWGTFAALLQQARRVPDLHLPAAELIAALHPLPRYWGYWDTWADALRFAATTFADHALSAPQATMLTHLSGVLREMGRLTAALAIGEQALTLARAHCAPLILADAGVGLMETLRSLGRPDAAQATYTAVAADLQALRAATSARDWGMAWANLRAQNADYLRIQGRLEAAYAEINQVLTDLSAIPEAATALEFAIQIRGCIHWTYGDYANAARDLEQALSLSDAAHNAAASAHTTSVLGLVYYSLADFARAETTLHASLTRKDRLGARWTIVRDLGNLGLVLLARGQLTAALTYLNQQIEVAERQADQTEGSRGRSNRGVVYLHLGRYAEAQAAIQAGAAYCQRSGDTRGHISCLLHLSRCHAWQDDPAAAQTTLAEAAALAADQSPVLRALVRRHQADYRPPAERASILQQTLGMARERRRRLDEADCLLQLASLAADPGARAQLWAQGAAILTEIGAAAWLVGATGECPPRIPITGI